MKKQDRILVGCLAAFALLVLVVGLIPQIGIGKQVIPQVSDTFPASQPVAQGIPADSNYSPSVIEKTDKYLSANPAGSYLLVITPNNTYSPIPLNEDNSFRITQPDGSENTVHIGVDTFWMEESNCDNQDCVKEGVVTLDNKNSRVLLNMVICLPHHLTLEMLTPEEARTSLIDLYAEQEAYQAAIEEYRPMHPEIASETAAVQNEG